MWYKKPDCCTGNRNYQFKTDNDNLSKIIHKDNKLIPAMVLSVKELLEMSITLDNSQLKRYV